MKLFSEKKYRIVFIISAVLAVFIITAAVVAVKLNSKNVSTDTTKKIGQTTKKIISPLDGIAYSGDVATRHPLAVSVENHPDARPQSGLSRASIVYEALTEGGITRYLAIYGPQDASEIGPIRSARLFFMDYLKEYDAFFAHAGGNEDALAKMSQYQIKDLEDSTSFFYRKNKGRNVASEHTLYSNTDKLYKYASTKGFDVNTSDFEKMSFKVDGPAATTGKGVQINFSSDSYAVRWQYDPVTNTYSRFLAGKEDIDLSTSDQLKAKNIIIQSVERIFQATGSYGSQNYVFQNIGSGKAWIMRDGQTIDATWKKNTLTSRTKYYDSNQLEVEMNPGMSWYEIIPPEISPSFF